MGDCGACFCRWASHYITNGGTEGCADCRDCGEYREDTGGDCCNECSEYAYTEEDGCSECGYFPDGYGCVGYSHYRMASDGVTVEERQYHGCPNENMVDFKDTRCDECTEAE